MLCNNVLEGHTLCPFVRVEDLHSQQQDRPSPSRIGAAFRLYAICLFVRLSVYLSGIFLVHSFVDGWMFFFMHPSVYLSVRPTVHPSMRPSIHPFIHPSIQQFIHSFIIPPIT